MKQVRQGVFETNSSSTHSICIAKNISEFDIPKEVHFSFGEFGWERDVLGSIYEKASYLYTGLIENNREDDFQKIVQVLQSRGLSVTAETPVYTTSKYGEREYRYIDNSGGIDHSNELNEFLNAVCSDETQLIRFLFSPLSFILTGNDNDKDNVDINVSYPHDVYYKGN